MAVHEQSLEPNIVLIIVEDLKLMLNPKGIEI